VLTSQPKDQLEDKHRNTGENTRNTHSTSTCEIIKHDKNKKKKGNILVPAIGMINLTSA
jgi:hypothetical protein